MILVIHLFYLICYKTKVILSVNFNLFIAFSHNSILSAIKVQLFKVFSSNIVVSHKPDQICRSFPPQAIQVKITTVILQGVTPMIFFILNQFHQLKQSTKILQGVSPRSLFFLSGSLQNQSQLLIVQKTIRHFMLKFNNYIINTTHTKNGF